MCRALVHHRRLGRGRHHLGNDQASNRPRLHRFPAQSWAIDRGNPRLLHFAISCPCEGLTANLGPGLRPASEAKRTLSGHVVRDPCLHDAGASVPANFVICANSLLDMAF